MNQLCKKITVIFFVLGLCAFANIYTGFSRYDAFYDYTEDLYVNNPTTINHGTLAADSYLSIEIINMPCQADISVNISGTAGSADVDFYNSYYDYEYMYGADLSTGDVDLSINGNEGGDYYLDIYANNEITDLVATISYTATSSPDLLTAEVIEMDAENPAERNSIEQSTNYYYRIITMIDVSAGENLKVNTSGGSGALDLYVYELDLNEDCTGTGSGTTKECLIEDTYGGVYFIELYSGANTFQDVTVDAFAYADIVNGQGATTGQITDTNFKYYKLNVPAGASDLYLETSGGSGTTADLYHKYGSKPTILDNDNNSATAGTNNESINIVSPVAGDHYIGVYSNGGTVDNVTLDADFTNGTLTKGVDETGISVSEGEWKHYSFSVPAGATDLTLTTSGGSGNLDLYTKFNGYPSETDNDGSDTGFGTGKSLTIAAPSEGEYKVSIKGGSGGASNITLNADYTEAPPPALDIYNGKSVAVANTPSDNWNYYKLSGVPSTATRMKIVLTDNGGNTDADLYHKAGAIPTTSDYDNSRTETGNNHTISLGGTEITSGDNYIGVYCDPAGSDCGPVDLVVRYTIDQLDLDGGNVSDVNVNEDNAWLYYAVHVPFSNYDELIAQTTGGTAPSGDVDLYMKYGDYPTISSYDFASADDNDYSEAVTTDPNGGYYYIGLYGSPQFTDIDLSINSSEGSDWVADTISDSTNFDIESNSEGDWLIAGTNLYKRDGRSWNVDTALPGTSFIADDRIYAQNGPNIDIYEMDASGNWSVIESGAIAMGLSAASYNYVLTVDGSVYDCTTVSSCSVIASLPGFSPGMPAAMSGNKIVYGDTNAGADGEAYVYLVDGTLEQTFQPTVGANGFGYSVGIHNDQIIIGMQYGWDEGSFVGGTPPGSAYIYKYTGGSWQLQQIVSGSDSGDGTDSSGHTFGADVDIYENYAIAGATTKNGPTVEDWGSSAYIFEKTPGSPDQWNEILNYEFTNEEGFHGDNFGFGEYVAITGNYYYGVAGPTPDGSGIIMHNNPTGTGNGGGGGGAVPEFSDYVLILTIAFALYFMYKTIPNIQNGVRRI